MTRQSPVPGRRHSKRGICQGAHWIAILVIVPSIPPGCVLPANQSNVGGVAPANDNDTSAAERLSVLPFHPSGASAVETNARFFSQPSAHRLHGASADTVLDDLEGLDGCWGAFADSVGVGPFIMMNSSAEFYRFDLSENKMTYQVLQRAPYMDVSLEHVYSFHLIGANRARVQLKTMRFSSSNEGGLSITEPMTVPAAATPFDLLITRDDDMFKFGESEGASSDWSGSHRAFLLFKRFECPE